MQGLEVYAQTSSPIAQLYERYASNILLYAYQHTSSYQDAEDIVVTVFLAALEDKRFLTMNKSEQLSWLRRVAHNKLVDSHRYAKSHSQLSLEPLENSLYAEEEYAPEQVLLREEEYQQLKKLLTHLPPLQQRVIHLRFMDGLRSGEIAKRLGKSESAIRAHLSRSLNLLRTLYQNQDREKNIS
jgi:RNA polymerase sigma factor (sigma-70 family)